MKNKIIIFGMVTIAINLYGAGEVCVPDKENSPSKSNQIGKNARKKQQKTTSIPCSPTRMPEKEIHELARKGEIKETESLLKKYPSLIHSIKDNKTLMNTAVIGSRQSQNQRHYKALFVLLKQNGALLDKATKKLLKRNAYEDIRPLLKDAGFDLPAVVVSPKISTNVPSDITPEPNLVVEQTANIEPKLLPSLKNQEKIENEQNKQVPTKKAEPQVSKTSSNLTKYLVISSLGTLAIGLIYKYFIKTNTKAAEDIRFVHFGEPAIE